MPVHPTHDADQRESTDAELAVVGSLLASAEYAGAVFAAADPDDFQHWSARQVIRVLKQAHDEGAPIDASLVASKLADQQPPAGGWLRFISDCGPASSVQAAVELAKQVHEAAVLRRATHDLDRLRERATKNERPESLAQEAEKLAAQWKADAAKGSPEWGEVELFDDGSAAAQFPAAALPDVLRNWSQAVAQWTQTPIDLPAMLSLGACAGAMGGAVQVDAGWLEPCNLYITTAMEPGERKSALFEEAFRPMRERELRDAHATKSDRIEIANSRKILEARLENLQKLAAKAADVNDRRTLAQEAAEISKEIEELPSEAPPQRMGGDDCTPEKLGMILKANHERLTIASAEGGVFDILQGQYSGKNGAGLDIYLKGFTGESHRVQRIGRPDVDLKRPAVCIVLAIQYVVLRGLLDNNLMRGRGLVGRFLYCLPESLIGYRSTKPPRVPPEVTDRYARLVDALCDFRPIDVDHGATKPYSLHLDAEADKEFTNFRERVEVDMRFTGGMYERRDWGGKLPGQVARIAGVLHCAERVDAGDHEPWRTRINATTMRRSILLGDYLTTHGSRAMELMSGNDDSHARDFWKWIVESGGTVFDRRDLHRAFQGRTAFKKSESLDDPLNELVRRNLIRKKCGSRSIGRPKKLFEINPAALNPSPLDKIDKSDKTPALPIGESTFVNNVNFVTGVSAENSDPDGGDWGEVE